MTTAEEAAYLRARQSEGMSLSAAARQLWPGIHPEAARKRARARMHHHQQSASGDEKRHEHNERTGEWTATGKSRRNITSLPELLAFFDVDGAAWEVETWSCKSWEGYAKSNVTGEIETKPLYAVSAKFKRNRTAQVSQAGVDAFIAVAEKYAPSKQSHLVVSEKQHSISDTLLEISLPDAHFGKLCWGRETGTDYDLTLARQAWESSVEALIARTAGHRFSRILLVVGNDLLNSDNLTGTTTAGTAQSMDSRYQKVFETALETVVKTIERLALIAPVDVLMVSGNHDTLSIFTLGTAIRCWFRNCSYVRVDNSPTSRKYYAFGKVLLMFTHGDKQKLSDLPLQMAADQPQLWGQSTVREVHCGHWHKVKSTRYDVPELDEYKGVRVRVLPSLCGTDAWHSDAGHTHSVRAAEAYVWDASDGLIGTATYSLPSPHPSAVKPAPLSSSCCAAFGDVLEPIK